MAAQAGKDGRGSVLVVGGGRFGRLAASRLGDRLRAVVEPEPSPELLALEVPIIREDGVESVGRALAGADQPEWVAPCLPRHLLADWLCRELRALNPRPVALPGGPPALPQVIPGPEHVWYLSLTDTLCPDDCPEPAQACPKTGQPRGVPLFQRLAEAVPPGLENGVLRSHQLTPGVGGFKSAEMLALRQRMARRGGRWLVGAACRCHGVAQAWELDSPSLTTEN